MANFVNVKYCDDSGELVEQDINTDTICILHPVEQIKAAIKYLNMSYLVRIRFNISTTEAYFKTKEEAQAFHDKFRENKIPTDFAKDIVDRLNIMQKEFTDLSRRISRCEQIYRLNKDKEEIDKKLKNPDFKDFSDFAKKPSTDKIKIANPPRKCYSLFTDGCDDCEEDTESSIFRDKLSDEQIDYILRIRLYLANTLYMYNQSKTDEDRQKYLQELFDGITGWGSPFFPKSKDNDMDLYVQCRKPLQDKLDRISDLMKLSLLSAQLLSMQLSTDDEYLHGKVREILPNIYDFLYKIKAILDEREDSGKSIQDKIEELLS